MKKQTIGERVKVLRDEYGLSQAEFAKKIEKTVLTVGNIERGISKDVQPETMNNIIKKFGTSREWLETGRGEMLPDGKMDLTEEVTVMSGGNVYRDYALKEKEEEAKRWYNEYLDMKAMLKTTLVSLGKDNAIGGTAQRFLQTG